MHAKYVLLGTINQEPSSLKSYRNPWLTRESLQEQFLSLTSMIKEKVSLRKPFSLVRFGDGDFFFLMRMAKGSARPGRRGSLKPYNLIDSSKYRYNFLANEEFGLELQIAYRIKYLLYLFIHWPFFNRFFWKSLLRRRGVAGRVMKNHIKLIRESIFGPKTSFETIYGLVANRWIFREFKDGISLIGSEKKIELIKNLMDHSEYRQYLGVEKFEQYIGIPEKGAADEPESILEEIGLEIQNSNTRIFLVGMGHGKTYLISALRKYTDAVIIDVGTGIDALAGCINHERPYFADWVNFRFKDFDYSAIDQMDYDSHKRDRNKYKTIWI